MPSRVWAIAKVAGPALVSVAALVISLAAYENQRAVNAASALSNMRQNADRVSFFYGPSIGQFTVANESSSPMTNVYVYGLTNTQYVHGTAVIDKSFTLTLTYLPPCTITYVNAGNIIKYWMAPKLPINEIDFVTESMSFTDNDGNSWRLNSDGILSSYINPGTINASMGGTETVKPSNFCF